MTDPEEWALSYADKRPPYHAGGGEWKKCPACKGSGKRRGRPRLNG